MTSVAMIAAPSFFMVGELLSLRNPLYEQDADPQSWFVGHILLAFAGLAFVPVAMAMMRLTEEAAKGVWLGVGGVTLVVMGVVASTGIITMDFIAGELAAAGDRERMLSLYRSISENPAIAGFDRMQAALPLGMLMLAVGLYLTGAAPAFVAALIAIGVVFGNPTLPEPLTIGARLLLLVGLSYLAWELHRQASRARSGTAEGEAIWADGSASRRRPRGGFVRRHQP